MRGEMGCAECEGWLTYTPGMARRWIIRAPFLAALVLVAGVWVASSFGSFFWYKQAFNRGWCAGAIRGLVYVGWDEGTRPGTPLEFYWYRGIRVEETGLPLTTFGFAVGPEQFVRDSLVIVFPLWFPALVLLGFTWQVWWRTRRGKGQSFPVEVVKGDRGRGPGDSKREREFPQSA